MVRKNSDFHKKLDFAEIPWAGPQPSWKAFDRGWHRLKASDSKHFENSNVLDEIILQQVKTSEMLFQFLKLGWTVSTSHRAETMVDGLPRAYRWLVDGLSIQNKNKFEPKYFSVVPGYFLVKIWFIFCWLNKNYIFSLFSRCCKSFLIFSCSIGVFIRISILKASAFMVWTLWNFRISWKSQFWWNSVSSSTSQISDFQKVLSLKNLSGDLLFICRDCVFLIVVCCQVCIRLMRRRIHVKHWKLQDLNY